jgi:hypothetical protein
LKRTVMDGGGGGGGGGGEGANEDHGKHLDDNVIRELPNVPVAREFAHVLLNALDGEGGAGGASGSDGSCQSSDARRRCFSPNVPSMASVPGRPLC